MRNEILAFAEFKTFNKKENKEIMKKTYQAPEIIETTIVSENIVATSGEISGTINSGSERTKPTKDPGTWNNIWNN